MRLQQPAQNNHLSYTRAYPEILLLELIASNGPCETRSPRKATTSRKVVLPLAFGPKTKYEKFQMLSRITQTAVMFCFYQGYHDEYPFYLNRLFKKINRITTQRINPVKQAFNYVTYLIHGYFRCHLISKSLFRSVCCCSFPSILLINSSLCRSTSSCASKRERRF